MDVQKRKIAELEKQVKETTAKIHKEKKRVKKLENVAPFIKAWNTKLSEIIKEKYGPLDFFDNDTDVFEGTVYPHLKIELIVRAYICIRGSLSWKMNINDIFLTKDILKEDNDTILAELRESVMKLEGFEMLSESQKKQIKFCEEITCGADDCGTEFHFPLF